RRRDFIVIAVGAWSHAARAQQKAMPVIGYLSGTFPDPLSQLVAGFRRDSTKPPNRRIPRQPRSIDYPQQPATQRVALSDDPAAPDRPETSWCPIPPRGGSRGRRHERAGAGADHKVTIIDEVMERL